MEPTEEKQKRTAEFEIKQIAKQEINKPIVIEGLPGIGNVGKVAVDFIIESIKAKKIVEISSSSFPHTVFVNEHNLIDLPSINIYYKKIKSQDFIFIAGDVQPSDERSCYGLCTLILDRLEKHKIREIITLGGIGLPKIPKQPKIYLAGNNKEILSKYQDNDTEKNIFGVVGPIIGVSGLLIGLAGKRNIPAVTILAQTFGHPAFIGIKSARELIRLLDKKFSFNINLKELDKEIKEMDSDIAIKIRNFPQQPQSKPQDRVSYIG